METMAATDIAEQVRAGKRSARTIVENGLADIAERNPLLNCYTQVMAERALREARDVDTAVAQGRAPGALAGVTFGVKDNYDIAGRITAAGSIINDCLPPAASDAVVLRRLTKAGAILMGTQNMDELAYGFTTENAHFGAVRNPLDTLRSAGGSSGGSAAAVAAGLCDFALGTDTNGSVRVPSSFCGLFGLKPTFGRLPRTGTFPFVHDLDHIGIFARTSADLALVYDVIQGYDAGDHACADRPASSTRHSLGAPLSVRVGILGGWFGEMADDQGRDAVRCVARALGGTATISLPGAARARAAAFILTCASGANLHFSALRDRPQDFDPATRDRLLAGTLIPAHAVLEAQRQRALFRDEVLDAFRRYDLLIAPATPCSATRLGQPTISLAGEDVPTRPNIGVLTQPLSFVGLPIVTAPIRNARMPIGVQLIAPPWQEGLALRAAAQVERAGVARGEGAP